ncbi:hypothetical protein QFC22_000608 [Naganishia vaughanmartiniae]|uniref:Uncharacterized protein n=1 Tax=Naganishia vaughanmartiniae TaxID=1424756 RepID=A0ACC2XPS4_9TREE|nr:hypothetical protein QFC22_000608 [Naganishia vaughanmartiniae]
MAPTKKTTTAPKPKASHPPFADMIKNCIQAATEDTRLGVSRPSIKKFLATTYKLDMSSAMNIHNLNKAITRGAETGLFDLPKGIGGRVKLVKKAKASANKENTPPIKKAPAAKKTVAAAPKKAAAPKAAPKKAAVKPAAPKKAAPAKKTAAPTKTKAAAASKTATKAAPKKRAAAAKK